MIEFNKDFLNFFLRKKKKNWFKSNKQKTYRLDKYRENQQNAARKWTEQKKKKKKNEHI